MCVFGMKEPRTCCGRVALRQADAGRPCSGISSGVERCGREPDGAECHRKQVSLRCDVRYIAPILVTLEAGLHSPACLYQRTVKPPMAPLEHIADIPAVGQELNRVIRL